MTPTRTHPSPHDRLSLRLEGLGEAPQVVRQTTVVAEKLDVGTVDLDAAGSLALEVVLATQGSEAPVLGNDDLLAAGELVL